MIASNRTTGYAMPLEYVRISREGPLSEVDSRWIGRCKRCKATHKLEGKIMRGARSASSGGGSDYVIQTSDGSLFTGSSMGSDPFKVWVPCGDHWSLLSRVHEGTKKSKHECGARCTNATGPNCDCRCKGTNHGKNC